MIVSVSTYKERIIFKLDITYGSHMYLRFKIIIFANDDMAALEEFYIIRIRERLLR